MAWQLIYTSAPRLLDAGRTGFGTVARHRAVSGLLASTIERFSQFARLPGFDTKRVVYSHRILTVGSGEFHVLSCLRDAGSDYTGRTNHLAHHIIAEAREIRNLGLAGITPADILLGMPWLETWTSSPRFLESADEINLSTFRNPESHEWQRLTGNLHHALLPWSPSAKKGLYFVLPPGLDARPLILESLQEHPGESWKIPFTTCLEPNDDVADFKWIAVPATSPLCPQPSTAARLILDLTQPDQLPAPPALPTENSYPQPTAALSPATLTAPAPIALSPDLPLPSSNPQFPSTAPIPAWSPTSVKPKKSLGLSSRLLIGSAAAIVMIGGALLISNFINQDVENRRVAEVVKEIDRIWKEQQPNLSQTLKLLKEKARTDPYPTSKLKELEAELAKIRKNLAAGVPSETANAITMTLDAEFDELLKAYASWKAVHEQAAINRDWTAQSPSELTPTLATLLGEESRLSAKVSAHFTDKPNAPTYEWRKAMHDNLAKSLSESKGLPEGTAKEWSELLNLIQPESPIPEWMTAWMASNAPMTPEHIEQLEALQRKRAKDNVWPNWVNRLIDSKIARHRQAKVAPPPTKPQENQESNQKQVSLPFYDDLKDTWPIYVAHQSDQVSLNDALKQLPKLDLNQETIAHVSPALEDLKNSMSTGVALLVPHTHVTKESNGTLVWRDGRMGKSKLEYQGSKFSGIPEDSFGGKIVFLQTDKPPQAVHIATPKTKAKALNLLNFKTTPKFTSEQSGTAVRILGLASLLTRLRNITDPVVIRATTSPNSAHSLDFRTSATDAMVHFPKPKPDVTAIKAKEIEIKNTEKAIEDDEKAIAETKMNIANREAIIAEKQSALDAKKLRLDVYKADLETLKSPKLPDVLLPPGDYTIGTATAPNLLICTIQPKDPSATPPK